MIDKKRIIIINNNLATGGVQKALINLLNETKDKFDITLFVFSCDGEYKKDLPKQINVIEANPFLKLLGVSQSESKKMGLLLYAIRAFLVCWTNLINNNLPIKWLITSQKKLRDFDIAISYLHGSPDKSFYGGCNEFVIERVEAKNKIAFIHCDYLNFGGNTKSNKRKYIRFDRVISVSNGCKNNFIKALPELKSKVLVVKNFHNYKEIKSKAETSPYQYQNDNFNILTIARLSEEKGIIRTIEIIAKLVKQNPKICWHIVGEGSQRTKIENLIRSYSLDNNIILFGNQENPYRFMKNADLFLLPSYHEAAPMVIEEAKCLGIPILTTDTISAKEMLEDYDTGFVCENTTDGITEMLEYILKSKVYVHKNSANLKNQVYTNDSSFEQFNFVVNKENSYG